MKALFVTSDSSLQPEGGGVQRCTREYLMVLKAAGIDVTVVPFRSDMRMFIRIRRKLFPRPYHDCLEYGLGPRLVQLIELEQPDWILFNNCDGLPVLGQITDALRNNRIRIAYLSHGLDSTDFLEYEAPGIISFQASNICSATKRKLGAQLLSERSFLQRIDLTCCLSPTDVEIHRWIGAQRVIHIPRVVDPDPVEWHPVPGRIGTISTLVHAPNYNGLIALCEALSDPNEKKINLRLVGRPNQMGEKIAAKYEFVDYLGGLSDADLKLEAASWSGFVNPIFSYPRGCSTKLSVPMNWEIPIFTSRAGARGYFWDENLIPLTDTPKELAKSLDVACDSVLTAQFRRQVQELCAASPTLNSVGETLHSALKIE